MAVMAQIPFMLQMMQQQGQSNPVMETGMDATSQSPSLPQKTTAGFSGGMAGPSSISSMVNRTSGQPGAMGGQMNGQMGAQNDMGGILALLKKLQMGQTGGNAMGGMGSMGLGGIT